MNHAAERTAVSLQGKRRIRGTWALLVSMRTGTVHLAGVSNLPPVGRMPPRMAMNVAQHKIINLLKIS